MRSNENHQNINNNTNLRRAKYLSVNPTNKQNLIDYVYNEGMTIVQAASLLGINYSNAKKIVENFRRKIANHTQESLPVAVRGPPRIIDDEIIRRVETIAESNSCYTLKTIRSKLQEQTGLNVSLSSVHYIISKLKVTLKQGNKVLEKVNTDDTKDKRQTYALNFTRNSPIDKNKCIFIDESGFNYHMRRTQARSKKDTRAKIVVPVVRGANKTLIVASNQEKILYYKIIRTGTCNGERFEEFISELIEVLDRDASMTGSWIIMDNARIHGIESVKKLISDSRYKLEFLSPYSYMLNPVEHIFSKIKLYVRSCLSNNDSTVEIEEHIENAIATITTNDCLGYTMDMMRNISLSIEKSDF